MQTNARELHVDNHKKLDSLVCIKVKRVAAKVKQALHQDLIGRRFDEALGTPMRHIESWLIELC